jgi:hypothetical protein
MVCAVLSKVMDDLTITMEVQLIANNDTGRNQSRPDEIKKRLPKVHIFNSDVSDSKGPYRTL